MAARFLPPLTSRLEKGVLPPLAILLLVVLGLAALSPCRDAVAEDASLDKPVGLAGILAGKIPVDGNDLQTMQRRVRVIAKRVLPATVCLRIGPAQGSGVVVSRDGLILTAGHAVGKPGRQVLVTFSDGSTARGITLGMNRKCDAGMVKLVEVPAKKHFSFVPLGDSSTLKNGQWCIATGHPGGYEPGRKPVVRLGRILAKNKMLVTTDCPLICGDSGGPLFDLDGRVIAIHSRIAGAMTSNIHVPIGRFRESWERLVKGETWGTPPNQGPFLGVVGDMQADNARISCVHPGSPAATAGLQVGDQIMRLGDQKVQTFRRFSEYVQRHVKAGDQITLVVRRHDKEVKLNIVVGSCARKNRLAWGRSELPPGMQAEVWSNYDRRDHTLVKAAFRSVMDVANQGTVRILCDGKPAALGMIVGKEGYVLTKASQLSGEITCRLQDGQIHKAEIVGIHSGHDLAMLRLAGEKLPTIVWKRCEVPAIGSWVATSGRGIASPLTIGVVSVAPRACGNATCEEPGTVVASPSEEKIPTTASERAAMRKEKEKASRPPLRQKRHKRKIVHYRFTGKRSHRRTGFSCVLQHDSVIRPIDCGGPLVDLQGNLIGLNIARASRVATYAIPWKTIQPLLDDLKSGKLSPPDISTRAKLKTKPFIPRHRKKRA